MGTITTKDGTEIFYKDWGDKNAQPIVFHHGWPLSADDWDTQMLFFLHKGFRVVAHDRRGHGRSSQGATGHDMDHYAADASARLRASRPQECRPYRSLDRRRPGRPLCREIRRAAGTRRQGGADERGAADHGQDPTRTRAACRSRSSTGCARRSPRTARSSISICRPGRSTATTGRARSPTRASSTTGGVRA